MPSIRQENFTETVQPTTPVDGADGTGSYDTEAEKVAAHTWKPFEPDDPPYEEDTPEEVGPEVTTTDGDNIALASTLSDFKGVTP